MRPNWELGWPTDYQLVPCGRTVEHRGAYPSFAVFTFGAKTVLKGGLPTST